MQNFQVICDEMTQRVASYALWDCDPPRKEVVLSLFVVKNFQILKND